MIQVTGILPTPMGIPAANVIIRVIALDTSSDSIPLLPASITTGSNGSYDFNLGEGNYSFEINFSNKYSLVAEGTITNSTISPITLPNLLNIL